MASLASINIIFNVDTRQLSTDLQNSIREVRKWGDAMQDVGKNMSTFITLPLLAAGGASAKFASDFSESQNKVDVAFGDSKAAVEGFAKTTLTSFGIAEGTALDMAALFGDMATSMGLPQKEAAKISTSLVGLAGDLASFKNIGIDQATTALNGVFTGETESLKMLGIVMTEANLAQFALSQGIKKSLKDFTQAEKVQLRYAYVMQQTTNAQGDFARTGGGAANQMRVLQEGLKEVAVQFGNVLLPALTAVIKEVNEFVADVKELDPAMRNTVIVVGSVAAAMGPLIYAIGSVAKGYANLREILATSKAWLVANPFLAIGAALGALAVYAATTTSRFTSLTDAGEEFEKVMRSGSESVAAQSAELQRNISIAKNSELGYEMRQAAIEKLNAISPEYLSNLTLENINTREATAATEAYTEALIQKARVAAAEEKLVDVQKRLLDLQLKQLDAVKPSLWQNFTNAAASAGDMQELLARTTQTVIDNAKKENKELTLLQQQIIDFIATNEGWVASNMDVAAALNDVNESVVGGALSMGSAWDKLTDTVNNFSKSQRKANADAKAMGEGGNTKTIKYYEGLIADLKKLQTETATTSAFYSRLETQIQAYQDKIDAIQGKRKPVQSVLPETIKAPTIELSDNSKRVAQMEKEKEVFLEVQKAYTKGTEQFEYLQQRIDALDFTIKMNVDPASVIKSGETLALMVSEAQLQEQRFMATAAAFNDGVKQILAGTAENFATGFGEVLGQMALGVDGAQGIWSLLLTTVANMAIDLGKLAISVGIGIQGIKTALESLNPALAIGAGVALVALGTLVKSQSKNFAGKFADGGIVGGSSFTGDKLFAAVNSGEMILNQDQQRNLQNMINPAVTASDLVVQLMGGFEIEGTTLKLVLERTDKKNNRKK